MKHSGSLLFALLMLFMAPWSGRANDLSSLVKLELTDCSCVSVEEVNRILDLELQSIARGHLDIAARPIRLTVTCAPGSLSMIARNNTTSRSSRRVRTDALPRTGMERIIAIAAAELALSTWEQLSEGTADTSPSEAHEAAPTDRSNGATKGSSTSSVPESVPQNRLSAALQIGALWRLYLNPKANLFGGELGGNLYFLRRLRLHLGIAPEGGRTDRALGEVSLLSVSAVFSFGVHGRLFTAPLEGGVDIGFRGGYGRLKGRPQSPPSKGAALNGGFGGPLLRLSLASDTRPAAQLSMEMGYAVFGLTGRVGIDSPVALKGPWISLGLDGIFSRR